MSTTLLTVNRIFQTNTHTNTHTYTIHYKLFAVHDMMWKSLVFHQQPQFVHFYNKLWTSTRPCCFLKRLCHNNKYCTNDHPHPFLNPLCCSDSTFFKCHIDSMGQNCQHIFYSSMQKTNISTLEIYCFEKRHFARWYISTSVSE